ncbi:MAG: polyprenol monophosphomannose synthase [Bacteroidota bacterium]
MSRYLVIIPTYKEKDNVELMIRAVFALSSPLHILIVDDSSPDGTADIVKSLQQEFPDRLFIEERAGKLGLGTAYVHGFQWGLEKGYEFLFEMDCDFSHNPKDLERLLAACETEGFDVAVGSRYVKGGKVENWPRNRVLLSKYASFYVRAVLWIPVRDTTAGFKCYRRQVLEKILQEPPRFVGYAFQIEMKFRAWKYGFKIKEVPITFTDRTRGESKMSGAIFNEAVFGVLKMRWSSLFKKWK